jgi:hypothetical protein
MMASPWISVASGVLGAVVGAAITRLRAKSDTTFDLHAEFSSDAMLKNRSRADKLLKEQPGRNLADVCDLEHAGAFDAVWAVVFFYEKLFISISHKLINKTIVPDLFGEIFIWWYEVYLREGLADNDWAATRRLKALKGWLQESIPQEEYFRWEDRARKDRDGRIAYSSERAGRPK